MSLINVLPENLVNQIAAGEVVERPASVVKEMVENSLDSGAKKIVIELRDGGKSFIKITDDGCGMSREDLELSIQRHATSKIASEKDLWNINTMGFRGEALASIASVSKMTIKTKQAADLAGYQLDVEGGDIKSIQEVGMSGGTQIEVYDLFYNTPARQKYLKKDSTELSHTTSLLNTLALANPKIHFKVIHNDKVISDLAPVTDLLSRIADVFGGATAEAMLPVFYGGSSFKIEGFIGKPLLSRSSSKHQYFFVNGRPIQHHVLANTIKSAYHSMLMENKKPVFLLNITIDPALIDVNVHPRKVEIRFEDQQSLIKVVYSAVKTALEKHSLIPKGHSESKRYMSDSFPKSEPGQSFKPAAYTPAPSFNKGKVSQEAIDFSRAMFRDHGNVEEKVEEPKLKPVLQIANSYIIAHDGDDLVLIDQHAAHERVRFEELMDQYENQKKSVQPLLVAFQMELSNDEISILEANLDLFKGLGFEIEPFGGKTFVINSVPTCLAKEDMEVVVRGVLDDITNEKNPSKMQGKVEEILTYMSCRSAIKFGQKLDMPEMDALVRQMEKLRRPYTCPHGRPTMVKLTLDELGKMFGRK